MKGVVWNLESGEEAQCRWISEAEAVGLAFALLPWGTISLI
jgi:hypothetical protein